MKIFVTGGSGFIGEWMVRELLSRDVDVISYDIVKARREQPGVRYLYGTILDEFNMAEHMRGCDAVLHLAAVLGVRRSTVELLNCLNVNIVGSQKVLQAAVMAKVGEVLVTSSSEVFGDAAHQKYDETTPFNPKSGYAVSKLAMEQYAVAFAQEYGINHKIVRFFNTYGPGQVAEFVVPRFMKLAMAGQPITVYGDGKQIRSFCHIADSARATIDVLLSENTGGEVFNIGNDEEPITMLDLAERVIAAAGSASKVTLIPFDGSDRQAAREIYRRVPDIAKARERLGFEPRIDLDAGLASIVESNDIRPAWNV
jgi:UDP-glucose 4-epimerase